MRKSSQKLGFLLILILSFVVACTPPEPNASNNNTTTVSTQNDEPGQSSYPGPEGVPTPAPSPTPADYPAPWMPSVNSEKVSFCDFNTEFISNPLATNQFGFSEPEVLFNSPGEIYVHEWIPESNKVLLSLPYQQISDTVHHIVETFDTETGETIVYVDEPFPVYPAWLDQAQAVVYETFNPTATGSINRSIWLSYGSLGLPELLVNNLSSSFAIASDDRLTYFVESATSLHEINITTRQEQSLGIEPTQWQSQRFPNPQELNPSFNNSGFEVVWNYSGDHAILFQFPTTYLYDVSQRQVCELNFGETEDGIIAPLKAVWSPNGNYVAFLTAPRNRHDSWNVVDLAILDFEASNLRFIQPSPYQYISDFVWSPDSQYLAALVNVEAEGEQKQDGLFIVTTSTDSFQQALPEYYFGPSTLHNLVWSSDGNQIAVICPLFIEGQISEYRLCLTSLTMLAKGVI